MPLPSLRSALIVAAALAAPVAPERGAAEGATATAPKQTSQSQTSPGQTSSGQPEPRTYAYGTDPAQQLKLIMPATRRAGPAPILVTVHGGAWRAGSTAAADLSRRRAAYWGARGYALVSVDYPALPAAAPLDQAQSLALALRWIGVHGRALGLDPKAMVVLGEGSGAHLAALLGAAPQDAIARGMTVLPRGIVALDSSAYDIEHLMRHEDELPRFYEQAFGEDPSYWRAASPMARIANPLPHWLMICGAEKPVSCTEASGFAEALEGAGATTTVVPVALSHAEIGAAVGRPGIETEAIDAFLHGLNLP